MDALERHITYFCRKTPHIGASLHLAVRKRNGTCADFDECPPPGSRKPGVSRNAGCRTTDVVYRKGDSVFATTD